MNPLSCRRRIFCQQRGLFALLIAGWLCSPIGQANAESSTNFLLWLKGGHAARVNAVSWSADGSVIASASDDATVKLWTTNGTLVRTLTTQPYQATTLAFSPDATKLAVGAYAGGYAKMGSGGMSNGLGVVWIWQATNGWAATNVSILLSLTNRFGKITSVAFSAGGANVASSVSSGSNYVHQVSDGTLLASKSGYTTNKFISAEINAPVLGVAFSAGGLLASACEDGTVRVWNSAYTQVWSTNTAHSSNVTAVAFSPDGGRLASASLDGTVRVWSTTNWSCLLTLTGHAKGVTSVAFSPDGKRIASGSEDQTIRIWNPATGTGLATASGHADAVTAVAFSPDSTRIVSGGQDNSLRVWSAADGSPVQNFGAHTDLVKAIAVSPNGVLCATAANDQSIQVRRVVDGLLLRTLPSAHTGCVSAIAFAPDSVTLASSGGPLDSTIKLWRLSDGVLLRTIAAQTNGVMALAFATDGATLASGGDCQEKIIQLWNCADGALLRTLAGQSNGVTALAFSRDGTRLASGGRRSVSTNTDSTVKVWAVANGTRLQAFACYSNNTESVAFSPDGNTVVAGSSGTNNLTLWNVADGSSRNFGTDTNTIGFVAVSPDGATVAAGAPNAINLWNFTNGSLSQTFKQETFRASCFAYSPGGNLFAYGREDATVAAISLSTVSLPTNHPPMAAGDSFCRVKSASLRIPIASLLNNDTDPDLDPLTLAGINLSTTNGVVLTTNATTIFYPSSANVDNQFTYTISDSHGADAIGIVNIHVIEAISNCWVVSLASGDPGPNSNTLSLAGIPNQEYVVQFTTNLATGPWLNLATNVVDTNGTWRVIDPAVAGPERYYRVKMP